MSSPHFRLATLNDIDPLVSLRTLMQKEVNPTYVNQISPSYSNEVSGYFNSKIKDGSYVSAVAEVDGKIISATGLIYYYKPPSICGGKGS